MTHVLICGTSTRAAAESAARAGFAVTAIDGYADLDQHPSVRALSLPRDYGRRFTPSAAARASRAIDCDAVVYLSAFENHPQAVATLARGRRLWGNPPDALRRARHPLTLADALRRRAFTVPETRCGDGIPQAAVDAGTGVWLMKPLRSGGGRGVRRWRGQRVGRGGYLQRSIDGTPASVVFVAAGGRAVPLGVSRQLCGDASFGAEEHRYCGSILAADAVPGGQGLVDRACALGAAAAAAFGLVGVNGVDFVARDSVPHPIEINPRWSSSMELVERLFGLSVFAAHADACERQLLPRFELMDAARRSGAAGKAILFAREDVVAGDTTEWLEDATVRDVPHPGERLVAGQPVCTVFAEAPDANGCYDGLVRRAERMYEALSAWQVSSRARAAAPRLRSRRADPPHGDGGRSPSPSSNSAGLYGRSTAGASAFSQPGGRRRR